jgi:hypothetical protein
MAINGKKYSKNPVPDTFVGGPITLRGSSLGDIVSRFSHTASGNGASEEVSLGLFMGPETNLL